MAEPSTGVRSDTGAFALVPEWLLFSDLSDRAVRLYAILSRYADRDGKAWPSRRTLATKLGCSMNTVDRARAELEEAGALHVERRKSDEGDWMSSVYTVVRRTPTNGETGTPTDGVQNESQGLNDGSSTATAVDSRGAVAEYDPRKGTKVDGRNLPWDALVEETGADERAEAGRIAQGLKLIRKLVADEYGAVETWRLASPEEREQDIADVIRQRAALYRDRWPQVELTPTALAANWARVTRPRPGRDPDSALAAAEQGLRDARGDDS